MPRVSYSGPSMVAPLYLPSADFGDQAAVDEAGKAGFMST